MRHKFFLGRESAQIGPVLVNTTCTVPTPIASMAVKSTPLIRKRASRIGSSPRFLIAWAFCRFFTFGGGWSKIFALHRCQSA